MGEVHVIECVNCINCNFILESTNDLKTYELLEEELRKYNGDFPGAYNFCHTECCDCGRDSLVNYKK